MIASKYVTINGTKYKAVIRWCDFYPALYGTSQLRYGVEFIRWSWLNKLLGGMAERHKEVIVIDHDLPWAKNYQYIIETAAENMTRKLDKERQEKSEQEHKCKILQEWDGIINTQGKEEYDASRHKQDQD